MTTTPLMPDAKTLYINRLAALKAERSSWISHWQQVSDYVLPTSGRFLLSDRNRGNRRTSKIIDSTATRANRILAAGLMSGMTSPARPWFRLATHDPALMQSQAVKLWLSTATSLLLAVFHNSNTYRALHAMYEELGAFGTGACVIADDFQDIIRLYPLTIGEYCMATSWRGEVDTLYREFQVSVGALVKEFGPENVSAPVLNMYNRGQMEPWVTVVHLIEPRTDFNPNLAGGKNMPFRSVYFEPGSNEQKVLRESGFRQFPALCPRWAVSGGDIYGNSPAMEALGDVKQLQHQQRRKGEAIDYMTRPPIQVSSRMKGAEHDFTPGGITFVDQNGPDQGVRSAFEVSLDLSHLSEDMQDVRGRIDASFYKDLFLMLESIDHTGMTATEVAERHEEKMLVLGPVVERLANEMLNPLIDAAFNKILVARGPNNRPLLPPPPPELSGQNLTVEFVSVLAQAQKAVGINGLSRYITGLQAAATIGLTDVIDNLDGDKYAESLADSLGVDPAIVRAADQRDAMRKQRAQMAAQQQASALAAQGSQTAKNLSQVNTGGDNAAADIMRNLTGYS